MGIREDAKRMKRELKPAMMKVTANYDFNRLREVERKKVEVQTNRFIYWIGILILMIANFIVAILLVPALLIIKSRLVYFVILAVGLMFGFIFDYLVKDIEHMERRHHLFAGLIIPGLALIDFFVINYMSEGIGRALRLSVKENPFLETLIFIVGFMLPFCYSYFVKKEEDI